MEPVAPNPTFASSAELASHVREVLAVSYARPLVIELDGGRVAVLDGKPLALAREVVLGAYGAETAALIEPLDTAALAWHDVPRHGLRLWRQHGRDELNGELVTELEHGDPPVQVVTSDEGWMLLRALDGAQGWIRTRSSFGGAPLDADHRPDTSALLATGAVDGLRLAAEAELLLDTPYVWGGTTESGVDCSGIVQRSAWRASRAWLPRHSRALLYAGLRVSPSADPRAGDVYVLQRRAGSVDAVQHAALEARAEVERREQRVPVTGPAVHPLHVAIALGDGRALHASRDALRVVIEPTADLLARYRVLGVRRFGARAAAAAPTAPEADA